eukprot:m.51176 g.51176  ORF g.51176 m.51176 type:complete len:624 (-) comp7548_c1_seq3:96-1967(-)
MAKFHRLENDGGGDDNHDAEGRTSSVSVAQASKRKRKIKRFIIVYSIAVILIALVLVAVVTTSKSTVPALHFQHGAVSADALECSTLGANVLKSGGNAVDAAVTTALCLGIVHGESSGIGGGGFMVVHNATTQESEVIDFREMAPATASSSMYRAFPDCLSEDADVRRRCASRLGGLASGVPGELRGLELAWQRHGSLPWADLVMPCVDFARQGFKIGKHTADSIAESADLARNELLALFLKNDGSLLTEGDILKRPLLANTLEKIARNGSRVFYEGEIAQRIVTTLQNDDIPGIITLDDMKGYTPLVRPVLKSFFHDYEIISAPAPASGSVLGMILGILSYYNLNASTANDPLTWHRIDESFRFAYAKRTELADPCCGQAGVCDNTTQCDSVLHIQDTMLDPDKTLKWRNKITDDMTHHNTSYYGAHYDVEETPGTTHFSIVDGDGSAVAMTSTVNLLWGSKVMTPDGIIMNNEMDDFATPGVVNAFGVHPSPANFVKPYKRPLSSSAPTIVTKNGVVRAVAGASGGTKITTSTAQVLVHMLAQGMSAQKSVFSPRIHDQLLPDHTLGEKRVPSAVRDGLKQRGHVWVETDSIAVTQAIFVDEEGTRWPASDFRKGGRSDGY